MRRSPVIILTMASHAHPKCQSCEANGPTRMDLGRPTLADSDNCRTDRGIRNFHPACGGRSGNRHSFRFSIQQILGLHVLKALVFHADQSLQWGSGRSTTSASIFCPAFQFSRELFTLVQPLNLSRKGPRPEPWTLDSLRIRNIKLQRLWECYFGCLVMIEQMGIIREEFMNWTGHSSSPEDTALRTLICEYDGESGKGWVE